jgi:hypothetical protein
MKKSLSSEYIAFLVKVYKKIVREGLDPNSVDSAWKGYNMLSPMAPTQAWCLKFVETVPQLKRIVHMSRFRSSSCWNEIWKSGGILEVLK